MRLYEKILKNINDIGSKQHLISIKASDLAYNFHENDKIRKNYIFLKNFGYIDLVFNSNKKLIFVERLQPGIVYFEIKYKEALKLWIPIAISGTLSIVAIVISIISICLGL